MLFCMPEFVPSLFHLNFAPMDNEEKQSVFKEVTKLVKDAVGRFARWLMPNPNDHWAIQVLKSIAKIPVVLLLVLCSPVLIVVLLIIFLIAL